MYRVATRFETFATSPGSLRWLGKRQSSEGSWYHVESTPMLPHEKEKSGILVEGRERGAVVSFCLFDFVCLHHIRIP